MIHTFMKEYGLSKSQIDEIYPEEAPIYLKFNILEARYKELNKRIEYMQSCLNDLYIQHGDANDLQMRFIREIERLQGFKVNLVTDRNEEDNELPDREAIAKLKAFRSAHNK